MSPLLFILCGNTHCADPMTNNDLKAKHEIVSICIQFFYYYVNGQIIHFSRKQHKIFTFHTRQLLSKGSLFMRWQLVICHVSGCRTELGISLDHFVNSF